MTGGIQTLADNRQTYKCVQDMFYQKLFQKCCMEIHVKIDICTFYLYKIHLGLNKKNVYSTSLLCAHFFGMTL
jgi:hypothetical protein